MSIFLYFFLLFVFFVNFTKDKGVYYMKKGDWIVLFTAPAALVYALHHFILGG